ncbi:hypothetical protein NMG60_11028903 [Bertholletia excelsa]
MCEPHYPRRPPRSQINAASCMLAGVFLVLLASAGAVVFLVVFRPKEPKIAVESVQFPTFVLSNGTVNFTFFQYVSVTNPNRAAFSHYDGSLQLLYSGGQVGLVLIPAGEIAGGRTQRMIAKFDVQSYPLAAPVAGGVPPAPMETAVAVGGGGGGGVGTGPTMEIETRMKLAGRVRVLEVFAHRVESRVGCSVAVEVSVGSVLGFHC